MPGTDRAAALRVARELARELPAEGAKAVVLFGSWARGDAYPESDLDIGALGPGPAYRLERRRGFLVSVSWRTPVGWRREFRDPASVGGAIPGWRRAKILHDPRGIAAKLKAEARAWSWARLGKRPDAWVAEELTGWAEEVHRLIGGLSLGRVQAAAVQRSVLALRLATVLAVRHRILYDSENRLWDLVAAEMGPRWRRAQAKALGVRRVGFLEGCDAALELFALAAEDVEPLLDHRQRAVVAHACKLIAEHRQSRRGRRSA